MESNHFHVLLESKVSNGARSWRNKRRSDAGKGVLIGNPSLKREPYIGNRRKDTRKIVEKLETIELVEGDPTKTTLVRTSLSPQTKKEIVS